MKYLLTIIIPIYNMQYYLKECLESLMHQSFPDSVEVLLIDDGSTDSSGVICDQFIQKSEHFRVIHQNNKGIAATRNIGIQQAHGKYIGWVDPDDYLTDDWWSTIAPVLEQEPDLILFDFMVLKNNKITYTHFDKESRLIERDEIFRELADGIKFQSHLCTKIFRRSLFNNQNKFNEKLSYAEDYAAMHHILFPVKNCTYIHRCLYVYRQRAGSLIHNTSKDLINTWLSVQLSKERYYFYTQNNIKVSKFGMLYWEIIFCKAYQSQSLRSDVWSERYKSCVAELIKNRMILQKTKRLPFIMQIRFFLLTHHMGMLLHLEPLAKQIIKHDKMEK